MRKQFNKESILTSLDILSEKAQPNLSNEEGKLVIVNCIHELEDLIDAYFEFDFDRLQADIDLIKDKFDIKSEELEIIDVGEEEPKKRLYCLAVKSHCEAPDIIRQVWATSKVEALGRLRKTSGITLSGYDDDFLLEHMGEL